MLKSFNNNVENEKKETIENILREYERNYGLTVEFTECTAGSKMGDNYMSVVKRIKIIGTIANGPDEDSVFRRTLIVKRQIASISRRQLFRCDEAFENEIAAYCHLIPVFREHYPHQVPYPLCFFAGKDSDGEVVILEDLCESGYKMVNRLKGLDYDHCKIVVQELAKLHSISLITLLHFGFGEERETVGLGSVLNSLSESVIENFVAPLIIFQTPLPLLVHLPTIMSKYSKHKHRTDKQLRGDKLDQLLSDYVSELIHCICASDLPDTDIKAYSKLYTVTNIKRLYRARVMYGLGIAMWLLPAVTFHPGNIPDLDVMTLSDFKDSKVENTVTQMHTPEYHTRMKDVALEFYQNGFLDHLD